MKPLVSIIIPVYNGSNYMREAIDSALAQTYPNIEVLVINDGSNDNNATDRIAQSYGQRIRYFKKENGGVSSALNLGIEKMRGTYFSWLSHDDIYQPNKIQSQIDILEKNGYPDNLVALCATEYINKMSVSINKKSQCHFQNEQIIPWNLAMRNMLEHGTYNGCAFLLPKTVFEKCGKFHEGLRYCQDFLMWLEVFLEKYSMVYCANTSVLNRIHDQQVTQTGKELFENDSKAICNLLLKKIESASSAQYNFLLYYAKRNAVYHNVSVVELCLLEGKDTDLISPYHRLVLRFLLSYGAIRPLLRRLYYVFKQGFSVCCNGCVET